MFQGNSFSVRNSSRALAFVSRYDTTSLSSRSPATFVGQVRALKAFDPNEHNKLLPPPGPRPETSLRDQKHPPRTSRAHDASSAVAHVRARRLACEQAAGKTACLVSPGRDAHAGCFASRTAFDPDETLALQ